MKVIQLREVGWKAFDLFERECRVLRALDHPAIPRYLDTFAIEEKGRYFLVMELVEGTPLRELVMRGELRSEPQLWNLLHQALTVLEYLHGLHPPVIHRDIKPANLIRRADGRLALVDFGGVRTALRPDGGSTVIGTFGYMAPEQLHGEATPATDLYGLGATLAALASGMEADKIPRRGLRVDLAAVMPSSPLRDLLTRLLEPDPTHRPGSVAAVRELLRPGSSPDAEAEDDVETDAPPPVADVVLRIVGTVGYVGLILFGAVLLPLVYFMMSHAWSKHPDRLRRLENKREQMNGALGAARRTMRQLARGERRWRALLPPTMSPSSPPKILSRGRERRRRRRC